MNTSAALGCIHRLSSVKGDITDPLCFGALTPHSNILLNGLHTAKAPLETPRSKNDKLECTNKTYLLNSYIWLCFRCLYKRIYLHLSISILTSPHETFFSETSDLKAEGPDEKFQHTSPSPALGLRSPTRPQWWNQ